MQDNYTKIDNRFIDEVMPMLKGSELACCMAIFRKTAGWGKKSAAVSVDVFSKITGITRRPTIIDALYSLEVKGIIKTTKTAGKMTVYEFCYQLNQNLESSVQNRTSDTENTSTENVTGTSVQNRTSTSVQKRTSSSIYKEKEKKNKEKREKKPDFFELNKKEIEAYIQSVIENGGNIHNEHAYSKKLIGQFIREDKATLLQFDTWLPVYQCEQLQNRYAGNCFDAVVNNERFRGELMMVEMDEDGKPSIQLRNQESGVNRWYRFINIPILKKFLEDGGSK